MSRVVVLAPSSGSTGSSTSVLPSRNMAEPGKIDLHLHSTESDGRLSPAALVDLAYRNGVRRLALTDHDTTAGLAEAIEAGQTLGVEVIPGVELSTDIPGREIHMLGLFLE